MTTKEARDIINGYVCTCGQPRETMKVLHMFLIGVAFNQSIVQISDAARIDKSDAYLIANLLDALGVTEHKKTIRNQNLTGKGEMLSKALDIAGKYDYDYDVMEDNESEEHDNEV